MSGKFKVILFAFTFFVGYDLLHCAKVESAEDVLREVVLAQDLSGFYRPESKSLDLSNQGIDNVSLHQLFVNILNFINSNKETMRVETLLLGDNKFDFNDKNLFIDVVTLLKSAEPLRIISFKGSTKRFSPGFASQAQGLGQQIGGLLTEAIEAGKIDSRLVAVAKYIVFSDDLTFPVIQEQRVPLTGCQRFGNVMKVLIPGTISIILSNGLIILGLYLSGRISGDCDCANNSTGF